MHPRRIIRNAIADAIRNGGTGAETRVWASREAPVKVESVLINQGPIILVYTRSDTIKADDYPISGIEGGVKRTLEIAVEITAVGPSVVDDKLDEIAEQVEALLENFQIPGLPATEINLMSTEIDSTEEFEQPLGGALMTFEAKYWKPYRAGPHEGDDEWVTGGPVFFPEEVSIVAPGSDTPEHIADCSDCPEGECP